MSHLVVTQLNQSNLEAVSAIEKNCFRIPWSKQSFAEELDNPLAYYLVAFYDGIAAGFIGSWFVFDECHIMNIAVLPEYRRKGVASLLLQSTIDAARKNGVVYYSLEVRESNQEAIALYEKYGFFVNGRRKNYYTDTNEDALLMWKTDE